MFWGKVLHSNRGINTSPQKILSERVTPFPIFFCSLLLALCFCPTTGFAQITDNDKAEISGEAQKTVQALEDMLNYLADPLKTSKASVAQKSYEKLNPNRVFNSPEVRVEDDTDPRNMTTPVGAPYPIKTYLNRFNLFFKTTRDNPISFSNIRVLDIDSKAYVYAKVFYLSKFNGTYEPSQTSRYQRTSRIAEVIAEKKDGKWETTIINLSFASRQQIIAALGDENAPGIYDELEIARTRLDEDQKLVDDIVSSLSREVNTFKNDAIQIADLDFPTYQKILGMLNQADSLASLSLKEYKNANLHLALSKVNANSVDSLVNLTDGKLREVSEFSEKGIENRKQIIEATKNVEQSRADAELTYDAADALIEFAIRYKDTTLDQKVNLFYKARVETKETNKAAKNASSELKTIQSSLKKLNEAKTSSYNSLREANKFYNGVDNAVIKATREKETAVNSNQKAGFLLSVADSMISKVEVTLGPIGQSQTKRSEEAKKLVNSIDTQLEELKARMVDVNTSVEGLEKAQHSTNAEIISEVEKLNLLAEKITQKINFSILQLNKDRSYTQTESEGKSNMDEKMKTLYDSKVKALETIAEVRRAKQRLAYSSQNVFKQVDAAGARQEDIKVRMANVGKKQKVISQQVKDSEKASVDAIKSEQAASNKAAVLDKRVKKAFKSVVKKAKEDRMRHTPYVAINYSTFKSSFLNGDDSPITTSHGDSQFGNLGISVYYIFGAFAEGFSKREEEDWIYHIKNGTEIPYTSRDFIMNKQHELKLGSENEILASRNDRSNFVSSHGDLRYRKYGIYLSPINHVYLKLGISQVKGTTWDLYSGNFPENELAPVTPSKPGLYAIDFDKGYSETGFILGAAFVWPIFQGEVGYDMLLKDMFINVGVNLPLKKTYFWKSKLEDYDTLLNSVNSN